MNSTDNIEEIIKKYIEVMLFYLSVLVFLGVLLDLKANYPSVKN